MGNDKKKSSVSVWEWKETIEIIVHKPNKSL